MRIALVEFEASHPGPIPKHRIDDLLRQQPSSGPRQLTTLPVRLWSAREVDG
jgi:hypothetical protein